MNQYIFDSYPAKMPRAQYNINWEDHDEEFILIRYYECIRVLVNKFKYALGSQMLTKRGVEHFGSKNYVELVKMKFASSYRYKAMLEKDHEDLVNNEGPHLVVPEHVTVRDFQRQEDGPPPLPFPNVPKGGTSVDLNNFRDVTRYLSNAILKTYKEKGGKKKQLRWGINDPTGEFRPYWWDEVEKLPHHLLWKDMPPPSHVSKQTWPLKEHMEVGKFIRECVRIYLQTSNVNPEQHCVQKVKRRDLVNRMRKRGHSMAHQDSSSSNSSGTSQGQVDQDNDRNDDNEQDDNEQNDNNDNVGRDAYEEFGVHVTNEDEGNDNEDNYEDEGGEAVYSKEQEYEEEDSDGHSQEQDDGHSSQDNHHINDEEDELTTDSEENPDNNNSFEAQEANFDLLDGHDSVSDDLPLVDLQKSYTQNDETLAFDSDEYPSSPENNVIEETVANPPLVTAQNFGRRPTPNQVEQKQTRKRRPPPEESPAQTRSRTKLNRLNDH